MVYFGTTLTDMQEMPNHHSVVLSQPRVPGRPLSGSGLISLGSVLLSRLGLCVWSLSLSLGTLTAEVSAQDLEDQAAEGRSTAQASPRESSQATTSQRGEPSKETQEENPQGKALKSPR